MTFRRMLAATALALGLVSVPAWAERARVIVQFKAAAQAQTTSSSSDAGTRPQRATWLGQRHGLAMRDGRVIDRHRQVVLADGALTSAQLAAQLSQDPAVAWAEPDQRRRIAIYNGGAPNDPLYPSNNANAVAAGQWYLRAPTTNFVSATNAQAAWALSTGASVVVADLDTGVLFNHPDLQGKFHPGFDFVSDVTDNRDNDGVDNNAADPGDWVAAGECSSTSKAETSSWHGTQTSSVIGARTNNGVGMAGMAPDAMVLPLRVLANCGGWDSDIIAAMRWAAGLPTGVTSEVNAHPARVLNLSLGSLPKGTTESVCPNAYQTVIDELTAVGVVVVAAAGNDEGLQVETPASCSGVIAVGGLRHSGTKVGYANVGPEVALSAPAGNCVNTAGPCLYTIVTATNSSSTSPSSNGHTYTNTSDAALGTSFSTPMVAGAVALMLDVNPALTPAQVKSLLQSSASPFPTTSSDRTVTTCRAPNGVTQDECICTTTTCGAGMLDVLTAVQAASPTAVPTVSVSAASTVRVNNAITLDGSASVAPTGRRLTSYSWSLSDGVSATISGASNQARLTLVPTTSGFVAATLVVTDNAGAQASRTVWVAVNAAGPALASIALPASSIMAGDALLADGSASSSGSAAALSYSWQLLQGADLAIVAGATNGATAQLQSVANQSGPVTVALTVDDGQGHLARQVASFEVVALHPAAALSASATSVTAGQSVTLDASQSTATEGRAVVSYAWRIVSGGGLASFSSAINAATANLLTTGAGTVRVEVTVTDSAGATDTRSTNILVTAAPSGSGSGSGGTSVLSNASSGGGAVDGLALWGLLAVLVWSWRGARQS